MAAVNKNDNHINASPANTSRGNAALEGGRHETGGLTSGKSAGKSSHMDGDVPAPGNAGLGGGGATSMTGADTTHPGSGATPAAAASAGHAKPNAEDPRDNPSAKEGKGMSIEEANASGDGTFGDSKFDAAAPGAAAKAQQLEAGARREAGEEGKINVHVN